MRVGYGPHNVEHAALRRAALDEALTYAPNWKQLKEARETLAKQRS